MKSAILRRLERGERGRLAQEPLAMERRLTLAHLLLLRAWFWMGKAEKMDAGATLLPGTDLVGARRRKARAVAHANHLIGDCLHETFVVFHLASRRQERADAARLRELVRATADETLVREAEARAQANLTRLVGVLAQRVPDAPPRSHLPH